MSQLNNAVRRKWSNSPAWRFFSRYDTQAVCNLCGKSYTFSGTTTNLLIHIKKYHLNECNSMMSKSGEGGSFDLDGDDYSMDGSALFEGVSGEPSTSHLPTSTYLPTSVPIPSPSMVTPSSTTLSTTPNIEHIYGGAEPPRKRKLTTSPVWMFFTRTGASATCTLCMKNYVYAGATTSLMAHLRSKHLDEITSTMARVEEETNDSEPGDLSLSAVIVPWKKRRLDDLLLQVVVSSHMPFGFAGNEAFRSFVEALDPSYEMPGPALLQHSAAELHHAISERNRETLRHCDRLCISMANYTVPDTNVNLRIMTAHVVRPGEKRSIILDVAAAEERLDEGSEQSWLDECLSRYDITGKVSAILVNSSSTVNSELQAITLIPRIHCALDIINNIVQTTIQCDAITFVLAKLRNAIGGIRRNDRIYRHFYERCKSNGEPFFVPRLDQPTQWSSCFEMISDVAATFTSFSQTAKSFGFQELGPQEAKIVNFLKQTLQPFYDYANMLGSSSATLSMTIPIFKMLAAHARRLRDSDDKRCIAFSQSLYDQCLRHCADSFANETLRLATFIDPRFCWLTACFNEADWLTIQGAFAAKHDVKSEASLDADISIVETKFSGSDDLWRDFVASDDQGGDESSPKNSPINAELSTYVLTIRTCPRPAIDSDPAEWWSKQSGRFPLLYQCFKSYYVIPTAAVDAEKLFREAGILDGIQRKQLKITGTAARSRLLLNCSTPKAERVLNSLTKPPRYAARRAADDVQAEEDVHPDDYYCEIDDTTDL